MKKIFKFKKNEKGQSLVEFALVLPILILLILGMVEFGWILNGQITLTSAAREGARAAIVCENPEAAQTAAITAVTNSVGASSLTNVTTTLPTFNTETKQAVVNVNAQITPIVGLFFSSDVNLTAKAEMRIE